MTYFPVACLVIADQDVYAIRQTNARLTLCDFCRQDFWRPSERQRQKSCDRSHYTTARDSLAHTTRQQFSVGDIRARLPW